ncbi:transcriptional regulator [Peribacillus sp. NPDC097198]|uniref:helix-turn-helix transcriptional regulator n=1 Tax=Peribacillus sp. NPDC097198 TaxID=3364397 RepID=UPI0037FD5471
MRIKSYSNICEFLNSFLKERKLSQTEIAESLNYTTSYINQILKNKKRISEEFLRTFSDTYTEFEFNDLMELLEKEKMNHIDEVDSKHNNSTPTKAATSDLVTLLEDIPNLENILNMITRDPKTLELLELLGSNPIVQSLVRKLSYHSEEIQENIEEQVDNFLDITISNLITRYTHKELKELMLKTTNKWLKEGILPGYDSTGSKGQDTVEFEGQLHLSNTAFFFTINSNNDFLSITTRYQDRFPMEEFINLIPGWVHKESKNGNLGSIYKNVPLQVVRIFNLSEIALKVKSLLSSQGVPLQNIELEASFVENYFK